MSFYKSTTILIALSIWINASAQEANFSAQKTVPSSLNERLRSVETWSFDSKVMGQTLDLFVGLPFGYSSGQKNYPTLLTLDADVTFGLSNDIPKLMAFEGTVPSLLVVGVSFRTFNTWINSRQVYLTPTQDDSITSKSGEANTFLSFIEKELLPFIDKEYRTKRGERILYGHSYAGLFTLHAMISSPDTFSGYIATSPSVDWHQQSLIKQLSPSTLEKLPASNLYLSIGEKENELSDAFNNLINVLKQANSSLNIQEQTINDAQHMGSIASAYSNGLRWVFKK